LPQRVYCHGCGAILYEGEELKSPEEILNMHDGKCPECGRTLSLMPLKIEVKAAPKVKYLIRQEESKGEKKSK